MANIYTKDNIAPDISPDIARLPDAHFSQPTQKKVSKTQSFVSAIETSIAYQAPQAISNASDYVVDKLNQVIYDIPEIQDDPNFDKWEIFSASELPDDAADNFDKFAKTEKTAIEFVSNYKLKQKQSEEAYANGLPSDIVSFMTGMGLDPTTYLTFGAGATMNFAKTALIGAVGAGSSVGLRKMVDETVTGEDVLLEVAGGTILGGVLGGAVQGFTSLKASGKLKAPDIKSYLNAARSKTDYTKLDSSVGAMAAQPVQTAPKIARGAQTVAKAFRGISPIIKAQTIKNDTLRRYALGFTGASVRTDMKVGLNVKDITYNQSGKVQRIANEAVPLRKAWRKEQIAKGIKNPSQEMFDEEYFDFVHGISPFASDAVKAVAEKTNGYFAEAAKFGKKYAKKLFKERKDYGSPVIFDGKIAQAEYVDLVEEIKLMFREQVTVAREMTDDQIMRASNGLEGADLKEWLDQFEYLKGARDFEEEEFATKMASEIADGLSDSVWGAQKSNPLPRFFNERTIDPKRFKRFLVKNPERMLATYHLNTSPQLALGQVFGTTDADEVIKAMKLEIEAENLALRKKIIDGQDATAIEKQIAANKQEFNETSTLIADTFSMINKTKYRDWYRNNPKKAQFLQGYDFYITMRDQEASGIMQVAEIGSVAFHHGFMKAIGKQGKALMSYIRSSEVREAMRKSANMSNRSLEYGAVKGFTDILLNSETTDVAQAGLRGAQYLEMGRAAVSTVTGYKNIIGFTRDIASVTQDMVMKENLSLFMAGKLKPKYVQDMAFLGLDKDNIPAIMKQIDKHSGEIIKGIPDFNIDKWDDLEAKQLMQIALQRDMRRAVNDITTGDINYGLYHPMIKPLIKLRQWTIGASQTYMLNGFTRPDADQMASLLFMVMTGALVKEATLAPFGRPTTNDASEFIWNGLSSTGMAGIYNILFLDELAQEAGVPMNYEAESIFTNPASVIAGVNKRTYDQLSSVPAAIKGDQRAWERLKRALPMQQYPFIRQALDIDNK